MYGTLDEIIFGAKEGRKDTETIIVFDSTGVAVEDLAVVKLIYKKAKLAGNYTPLEIV